MNVLKHDSFWIPDHRISRRAFLGRAARLTGGLLAAPFLWTLMPQSRAGTAAIYEDGGSGDLLISLSNAAFCRAFDIGEWTVARFGIRALAENNTGVAASYTPNFMFGFQSGESDLPLDASSTNLVGWRTTKVGWTAAGVDPNQTYAFAFAGGQHRIFSKTGASYTNEDVPSSTTIPIATIANASGYVIQITKGSPYQAALLRPNTGLNAMSRAVFLDAMVAPTFGLNTSETGITGYTALTDTSLAFTETAGTLDHIFVAWDRHEFSMWITDIAISKVS